MAQNPGPLTTRPHEYLRSFEDSIVGAYEQENFQGVRAAQIFRLALLSPYPSRYLGWADKTQYRLIT